MAIKFVHLRRRDPFFGQLDPRGGVTIAYDIDDTGKVSYTHSICSDRDHYCRRIGRMVSTGRLVKGNTEEHPVLSFQYEEGINIVEQIMKNHDLWVAAQIAAEAAAEPETV